MKIVMIIYYDSSIIKLHTTLLLDIRVCGYVFRLGKKYNLIPKQPAVVTDLQVKVKSTLL